MNISLKITENKIVSSVTLCHMKKLNGIEKLPCNLDFYH